MALPGSGQISFDNVRVEFSQSLAPKYTMSDWTAGAWASQSFGFSDVITNRYSPVNLTPWDSRFPFNTASRFDPYLNNDVSFWYDYNHTTASIDDWSGGGDLYTHTGQNYCYPSTMFPVTVGTSSGVLYIEISGSADYYIENVYAFYGKPWGNNGITSGSYQLITASGHDFFPYTGDVNLAFEWDYNYSASLGDTIYFVIYGDYCTPNNN